MESLESATKELEQIDIQLNLLHKKKRAIKNFILEEEDRMKGIASPRTKAWVLKHDIDFIAKKGRERTLDEVADIMCYSKKQVQRYLKEKDS